MTLFGTERSPPCVIGEDDLAGAGDANQPHAVWRERGVLASPGGIKLIANGFSGRHVPGVRKGRGIVVKDHLLASLRKKQGLSFARPKRNSCESLPGPHMPQKRGAIFKSVSVVGANQHLAIR